MSAPNPEILSRLYNLDPESFLAGPDALRRRDGSPATPEDVEAFKASTVADWQAASDLWKLAVDQANYELDRQERISALCHKYQRDTNTDAKHFVTGDTTQPDGVIYNRGHLSKRVVPIIV